MEPSLHSSHAQISLTHVSKDRPHELFVSPAVKEILPKINRLLELINDPLDTIETQRKIRSTLMQIPAWSEWIQEAETPYGLRPLLVKQGLGTERDDQTARKMLVGLALSLLPDHFAPPYIIDELVVTEVIAEPGSSKESHSKNDLPAPPHCAGFFESVPPCICVFSCVRPHRGGGAATTVLNLESVLDTAPHALIDEWMNKTYFLRTSKRLGEQELPMKLLSYINELPFLRYRKEYMVDFDKDPSLQALEELILNPANHYIVPLQAGETLLHWNGAPHSRMPQHGPTPLEISDRRKLIRCRTIPESGWEQQFENVMVE
jgi:hypothetical protein